VWGLRVIDRERLEDRGAFWAIQKYSGLQMGPTVSEAYMMVFFRELKSYNSSSPNR
jgi:hypothetical protein